MALAAVNKRYMAIDESDAQGSPALAASLNPEIPDRYEMKYIVPAGDVEGIRRAIEPFCALDPHSKKLPSHQYVIHSLYLDSPDLYCYRLSRAKPAHRWKARVRQYGEGATVSPMVFLEVKNKDHDMVKKARARIPAEGWRERILGEMPVDASPAEIMFRDRMLRYRLEPKVMVRYEREAWMSEVDFYARVTFDYNICAQEWSEYAFAGNEHSWLSLDSRRVLRQVPEGVVVELKCTTAVPRWMSNLANSLAMSRTRYSKFCNGIERLWGRDTLLGTLHHFT